LLAADGSSYLELEKEEWSEGFLDPHETLIVYRYQLHGWFEKEQREELWIGDVEGSFDLSKAEFSGQKDENDRRFVQIKLPYHFRNSHVVKEVFQDGVRQDGDNLIYYTEGPVTFHF